MYNVTKRSTKEKLDLSHLLVQKEKEEEELIKKAEKDK